MLLLHGWTCDGADWSWLAADLAIDHRVVILDMRGHGRSTQTVDPYGAQVLAEDIARVLRNLAIDRAVVVGHSMGAIVASTLAVEFPNMVSALVLIEPTYGIPDERAEPLTAAMKQDPLEAARDIFSRFYVAESPLWQRFWHDRRLQGMSPSDLARTFLAMWGPDSLGRRSVAQSYLERRKCPMLAVCSGCPSKLPSGSSPWPTVHMTRSSPGPVLAISCIRSVRKSSPGSCATGFINLKAALTLRNDTGALDRWASAGNCPAGMRSHTQDMCNARFIGGRNQLHRQQEAGSPGRSGVGGVSRGLPFVSSHIREHLLCTKRIIEPLDGDRLSIGTGKFREACTRCRFLRVDPAQLGRIDEMTENAEQRLVEAQDKGWLGEVAALEESLKHLRTRQAEAQRRLGESTNPFATETAQ